MTQKRRIRRPSLRRSCLATAAVLAGIGGLAAPQAGAADRAGTDAQDRHTATVREDGHGDEDGRGDGIRTHDVNDASTAGFWTTERIMAAKPAPLPGVSRAQLKRDARELAADEKAAGSSVKGSGSGGSVADDGAAYGDGTVTVDGTAPAADGVRAADITRAQRWHKQGDFPARAMGRLLYRTPSGGLHQCTAAVITSDSENTLWTAGHCVHQGDGKGYNRNFVFIPDADNNRAPWGRWYARTVYVPSQWTDDGNYQADVAAIRMRPDNLWGNLEDAVGAFGYQFGAGQDFADVHSFGYPGNGYRRTDFNARELWYCQGPTEDAGFWFDERLRMSCDMGGGASGGPMVKDLGEERGDYIVGANSHRGTDDDGSWANNDLYSSNHGLTAVNTINRANGD